MLIKASAQDIRTALEKANETFGGNLTFNNFTPANGNNSAYRVTIRVKNSKGPGHRLGFPSYATGKQRRLVSACWHAHGTFFDCLPEGTKIQAGRATIYPGDQWEDRNIGSSMHPMMMSEACECK